MRDSEFVQLFDYLKCRGDRLGLLVNMGLDRVDVERRVYDACDCEVEEKWDYWSGSIQSPDRDTGVEAREALHSVLNAHGTGYGSEVTEKLIHCELRRRGLPFTVSPIAESCFRGHLLGKSPLDCLVIDGRIMLTFTTLFDDNTFSIGRGKSFIKALGLEWGIAANFGKRTAQFAGLHASQ